ncbi:MAG TPA: hypothetical protein VE866_15975, partial [Candidatus Binatia bacterium]|nr:hypothetical protein [Candidatus Binatia bacterium]
MRGTPQIRYPLLLLFLAISFLQAFAQSSELETKMRLRQQWYIQPSTEVLQNGSVLSSPEFQPKYWYRAAIPSTV